MFPPGCFSLPAALRVLFAALAPAIVQAAPAAAPSSPRISPDNSRMLVWRLDGDREIVGSIEGYSMQSRVISLRQPGGLVVHVSPRDLTAASKWQWYGSPEFREVARSQPLDSRELLRISKILAGPAAGVLFGAFLSFWASLSLFSGQTRMLRAAKSYLKAAGISLVIGAAAVFTAQACAMGLSGSPVAGPARDTILVAAVIVALLVVTSQVATDYDLAGLNSFASVAAGALILFLGSGVTLYLLPRLLERPGLDDWVTDRLLAPLGFA